MSDELRDAQLKAAHGVLDAARDALLDALAAVACARKNDRDWAPEVAAAVERAVRARLRSDTPVAGGRWELYIIDGRSSVSNGVPLWGVSLTLIENGRPVLGMVGLPICQKRFWAVEGQGAYCNGEPLSIRTTGRLARARVSVDVASPALVEELERRGAVVVPTFGSTALDLAWVAAGHNHATFRLSAPTADVAAGVVLVHEAGGSIDDLSSATVAGESALCNDLRDMLTAVPETGTTERPPGWVVDLVVDAYLDGVGPAFGSLALEVANKGAARLSSELPASLIRLPFDVTADVLLRVGESARQFADRLATDVALAAHAPAWAAPIIGRIAGNLATRAVQDPVQMAALTLRVTGWVLEHELTHYLERLEHADVDVDLIVSQLVSEEGRTELHELILGGFAELLASEGFQEELRLVVELHEQPAQAVDRPDPTPAPTRDPDLSRARAIRIEEALEKARRIEHARLELDHKPPARLIDPPIPGPG